MLQIGIFILYFVKMKHYTNHFCFLMHYMEQLIIKIQGFDYNYVNKARIHIQKTIKFLRIYKKNYFILPSTRQRYTVERSPHIDKKSREQFEIKTYKTIITIKTKNNKIIQLLFNILKNSIYPGVQITISTQYFGYLV